MRKIVLLGLVIVMIALVVSCAESTDNAYTIHSNLDSEAKGADAPTKNQSTETQYKSDSPIEDVVSDDYEPGVILLGLHEPYKGNLSDLFPELSIAQVEDINLTLYETIKDLPGKKDQIANVQCKIGTEFIIVLTDATKESVLYGISSIQDNPIVAYATPNYLMTPS